MSVQKASVPFLPWGQDWERNQPEPVTLLDEDVPGHSAVCGWQSLCLGGGLADS